MNIEDVGVVIQGPTNYCAAILANLDPDIKYLWSTWNNEPLENLKLIGSKIDLVVGQVPPYSGARNINLQCLSTTNGITYLDKKYIVKVRGDILWSGHKELLTRGFNAIEKNNSIAAFLNYKPSIQQIHDFVSFSTKENALKIWGYQQIDYSDTPPENQLVSHMMKIFNKSYDELVQNMSFLNILMEENKYDLFCIKYNVSLGNQCNTDLFGVPSYPKK